LFIRRLTFGGRTSVKGKLLRQLVDNAVPNIIPVCSSSSIYDAGLDAKQYPKMRKVGTIIIVFINYLFILILFLFIDLF
jgi:hypothetical protein